MAKPLRHHASRKEKRGRQYVINSNQQAYYAYIEREKMGEKELEAFRRPPYAKLGGKKDD